MYDGNSNSPCSNFKKIINQLKSGETVPKNILVRLLSVTDNNELDLLYSAAREVRNQHFGNQVFLYGFLYFSTYCRNNCRFCNYQLNNVDIERYRKDPREIFESALQMSSDGAHLIDLTMGEDPAFYRKTDNEFDSLLSTIKEIKKATGLPVMLSPGALSNDQLNRIKDAGTDWYACYQETHNRDLFHYLRTGQNYDYRLDRKKQSRKLGLLFEEGLLLGAGETLSDIADSILWMKENGPSQVRAMRFVPPSEKYDPGLINKSHVKEETVIAVMRLLMPDKLIPASLDVDGIDGLQDRLNAGANVITSIIPANNGLAGVANQSLDIEDNKRSLSTIVPILEKCGLESADPKTYQDWVQKRKTQDSLTEDKKETSL